ncbi:MAG: TlpA disulfide reductase family protein [Reyranellaceae bacterium]
MTADYLWANSQRSGARARSGRILAGLVGVALAAIVAISAPQSSAQTAPPISGTVAGFKPAAPPREAPPARFVDPQGQALDLGRYRGKVVLVNFWATWCAPCVREMPSLDRLQAALGGEGLVVLPLSLDGPTRPRVEPFYKDRNLAHLPILFDEKNATFGRFAVAVLPTTILIDRDGREVGRLEGPAEWDAPEAVALIRHYLKAGS